MGWLKDAYLDVIILLFFLLFAFYPNNILEVVLWVYSGLLLISKIMALFMPSLQRKANNTEAPPLFYHLIYAATVALLFYIQSYYLGTTWCVIWLISVINMKSSKKASK
jgi:hypothetical protein